MRTLPIIVVSCLFTLQACKEPSESSVEPAITSSTTTPPKEWADWARWADALHRVDDGQGHGPDVGSDEWSRALDEQLKISDSSGHGPDIGSDEWRRAVESKLLSQPNKP